MRSELPAGRAVFLLAAATIAAVMAASFLLLGEMRQDALERALLDTLSTAQMLREQTKRAFEGVDAAVRGVQLRMQSAYGGELALDGMAVHLLLRTRSIGTPHLKALSILAADGSFMNSSRVAGDGPAGVAAMPPTKAFRADGPGDVYVDEPVRDPVDGTWTIGIARAFGGPDGRIRGMIVATMEVPRFDHFYRWLKLQYVRPLALYLADGTLVASLPHRENLVGEPAPELSRAPDLAGGDEFRMLDYETADGRRQSIAIGKVDGFPLLVGVTNDREPALAGWRERIAPIAAGAILVCGFTAFVAVLLAHELRRRESLAQALREADDRYHCTVDSLMDAVVAMDASHRILLFNPAAERMFGLSHDRAVGTSLLHLLPACADAALPGAPGTHTQPSQSSRGVPHELETTGVRSDGAEFPVEASISQTSVNGQPQFTAVLRDVSPRRQAETELREMNRQLRALSTALQDVREQERRRIAAELHDELGQHLTGLKLELSWLANKSQDGCPPGQEELGAVRHRLDQAIASVRRIATELRPMILDDLGLGEAVRWLAGDLGRRSGIAFRLDISAAASVHGEVLRTALFRMVQESLTNVVRHARACSVEVQLLQRDGELLLRVVDDGCGFDMERSSRNGSGLVGIRERATVLGGQMRVVTAPGNGTTIEIAVPLQESTTEARI